ncbi:MAG: division/cell wall cluster transcriptional repressor MraZ [Nocardioides sp.]|jgi:MraZ protein
MFVGTYTPKLDDKGRLVLPAKFREPLEGGLMVARGQEHCVQLYPMAQFHDHVAKLRAASLSDPATRSYVRLLGSGAFDQVPDKQGRISVPQLLRTWASLDKEVVAIGSLDRVEIWDPALWEEYLAQEESSFAELNQEIVPAGG